MTAVGAFEAKTHFSQLLDRVKMGEEITATRHGKPVAKLVPIEVNVESETSLVDRFQAFRLRIGTITQDQVAQWKNQGSA